MKKHVQTLGAIDNSNLIGSMKGQVKVSGDIFSTLWQPEGEHESPALDRFDKAVDNELEASHREMAEDAEAEAEVLEGGGRGVDW